MANGGGEGGRLQRDVDCPNDLYATAALAGEKDSPCQPQALSTFDVGGLCNNNGHLGAYIAPPNPHGVWYTYTPQAHTQSTPVMLAGGYT